MLKIHFFAPIRKDWSKIQINSFQMQKRTKKKWQRWYETILGPLKQISLFGIKEMEVKQKRRITLLQNLSPPRFGIFSLITLILLVFYLFCPFCLIACTPVHWSRPGFPVLHHLLEFVGFMSIQWWCYLTISSSASPFSFCLQSFPETFIFHCPKFSRYAD